MEYPATREISYPATKRRITCTGQLQVIEELRPPSPLCPPLLQQQHPQSSPGSQTPDDVVFMIHPPTEKPPAHLGARSGIARTKRTFRVRPVATNGLGNGGSSVGAAPFPGACTSDLLTREKLSDMQKDWGESYTYSYQERDLETGRLQKEKKKLKGDHADLVIRLQKQIGEKEQKIKQLEEDVEKKKKENKEKDDLLFIMSAKCSRIREKLNCELRRQEAIGFGDLECALQRLQSEIQKINIEHENTKKQLAEKTKTEQELQETRDRQVLQLREMGRRERLLKDSLNLAQQKLESFKTQVIQASFLAADVEDKTIKEQQVIEKLEELSRKNQKHYQREKHLQEELNSRLSKENEVSANIKAFEKFLQGLQVCLRSSCSSETLRGELSRLEATCLEPSISAIKVAVMEMMQVPLSWLEGVEQLLANTGINLHALDKGLLAAFRRLLKDNQETAQKNQMLQVTLEGVQKSQEALMKKQVKELKEKYEQDLQIKINEFTVEKTKENEEVLERAVAKEKDKYKQSMEEQQKKIQDLEDNLKNMTEAIVRKSKELEETENDLQKAVVKMENAATREMALQKKILTQNKELKKMREEMELQQQKLQKLMVEYKEPIKQHSLTIVALGDRFLETKQQQKALEEEKAEIMAKMEGRLSEEQKVEMEQKLHRIKDQEQELNLVQQKLSHISLCIKDQALKAAELRQYQSPIQALQDASQEMAEKPEDVPRSAEQGSEASEEESRQTSGPHRTSDVLGFLNSKVVAAADGDSVATVRSVPQGGRLDEWGPGSDSEPADKQEVPGHVCNSRGDGVMSSEDADAIDFGEDMYLEAIGALGSVMKVKELLNMQPLKHLPQEERDIARLQRGKALDLLYCKVRNLKVCLDSREDMLEDYKSCKKQLRQNELALQTCKREMFELQDEVSREAKEKAQLKKALEKMQLQLNREKRKLQVAKLYNVSVQEQPGDKLKAKVHVEEASE